MLIERLVNWYKEGKNKKKENNFENIYPPFFKNFVHLFLGNIAVSSP
jgi:hypothetical protein